MQVKTPGLLGRGKGKQTPALGVGRVPQAGFKRVGMKASCVAHSCLPKLQVPLSSQGIFKGNSRFDYVSGMFLSGRLWTWKSRAPAECIRKRHFHSAGMGQGICAPAVLTGRATAQGSELAAPHTHQQAQRAEGWIFFYRGAPGNALCIPEVSVSFLSLPCHNNGHFLRRKGDHRAEADQRRRGEP